MIFLRWDSFFGFVDDASVLLAIWKTSYPYIIEVTKDIIDEKGMEFLQVIKFWKYYDKLILGISKQTIKSKSLNQGIADYIRTADEKTCQLITKIFKIVDFANKISNANISNLESVVKHFLKKTWLEVLAFFGLYGIYLLLVFGFLKPILIREFTQMTTIQLMIYPLFQLYTLISVIF